MVLECALEKLVAREGGMSMSPVVRMHPVPDLGLRVLAEIQFAIPYYLLIACDCEDEPHAGLLVPGSDSLRNERAGLLL